MSFVRDIHPILAANCASCHLGGNQMGGLQLDNRASILKGGDSGPAVVVGNSAASRLIRLVSGAVAGKVMPLSGRRLTPREIALLRAWIDQGLSFDGMNGGPIRFYEAPLAPRTPVIPPAPSGLTNPIDRFLVPYFRAHGIHPGPVVDDRTYLRRVSLDLNGLLPAPAQLRSLQGDHRSDKRLLLAQSLLDNRREYAVHWLSFWNDALRNDYAGAGYIDGGRQQITGWLYNALLTNKPYDQFTRELVDPVPGSEGFVKGIVWRGTVNASQTPAMQAAQNVSQVFLGINLKCASCHDSFISNWKLSDSYGLASVYAGKPLELVRCDTPQGRIAPMKFLYPQLGAIDPSAPREVRLKQLADALTSPKDGRFARTIVNRLWQKLMGHGFIEPADEMDHKPWSADLLDWLASDLVDHHYDLKHTILLIVTSRAYQLPAMRLQEDRSPAFAFAGPVVKRMSAEEFVDAVDTLTGDWPDQAATDVEQPSLPLNAKWIWDDPAAARAVPGERIYLRKTLDLPTQPTIAAAVMSCDNQFNFWVNGQKVASGDDWMKPVSLDLAPYLRAGKNVLAVEAINWPDPVTGRGKDVASGPNPAGFVFDLRVRTGSSEVETGSDSTWRASGALVPGWEQPGFDDSGWKPAAEVGDAKTGYGLAGKLSAGLARFLHAPGPVYQIRAALRTADPLMTALDRPNREQVVTERSTVATTLQALELTNGRTLAAALQHGSDQWLSNRPHGDTTAALVNRIFQQALLRNPTPAELQASEAIVGEPARPEGVQDLLWTLTMLPEFQLID